MSGVAMSKVVYYRETDPKTGKQTWVKLERVKTNGEFLFIEMPGWKDVTYPVDRSIQIVYKRTRRGER